MGLLATYDIKTNGKNSLKQFVLSKELNISHL